MSILNRVKSIIKKEKDERKTPPTKKEGTSKEKKEAVVSKTEPLKPTHPIKKTSEESLILKFPHISEKATLLSENNKYVFRVFDNVNKIQIKEVISNLYGVKVKSVKIINEKPKQRRLRNFIGRKGGYKKAIVTIEKGQKIEILPH